MIIITDEQSCYDNKYENDIVVVLRYTTGSSFNRNARPGGAKSFPADGQNRIYIIININIITIIIIVYARPADI